MERIKNTLWGITFTALVAFPSNAMFAQTSSEKNTSDEVKRLNIDHKLVADKVTTPMETAAIDSIQMQYIIDEEDENSPADEIYDGIWNNQYVKAYAGVAIPDSFRIDLSNFVMPVEGKITSPFGPRRRRFHYGTDIKLQVGDPVVAAFEGKVRVERYERRGYGNFLVIRHPNGLETVYAHLSEFLVNEGDEVKAGQPIALGGNTGRSTGSHLHFECRFLGQAINPADIVDFNNFCTYDDSYVFHKSKTNGNGTSVYSSNKYTNPSSDQFITYHRIRTGDTLSMIALRYKVSVRQICQLNGIQPTSTLRIGRVLRCS